MPMKINIKFFAEREKSWEPLIYILFSALHFLAPLIFFSFSVGKKKKTTFTTGSSLVLKVVGWMVFELVHILKFIHSAAALPY